MFNSHSNSMRPKLFIISIFLIYIGVLLPWLHVGEYTILGIQVPVVGLSILILLSISLGIFFFVKNSRKLVSVIFIVVGFLSLIATLFAFFSYWIIISIFGIFTNFGIGIYLSLIGSLGLAISEIMHLIRKEK